MTNFWRWLRPDSLGAQIALVLFGAIALFQLVVTSTYLFTEPEWRLAIIEPSEFQGNADDVRLLTQRYTTALENIIRESPEQYLWLHRRWKHQPKARIKKKPHFELAAVSEAAPSPIE